MRTTSLYEPGDRVRLVAWATPEPGVPAGTEGVVRFVDGVGTAHVQWDNGSTLGLCREDRAEVVA